MRSKVNAKVRPFYPQEWRGTIEKEAGWDPGALWTLAENLILSGIRSPDRPARSGSLYRLRYKGKGKIQSRTGHEGPNGEQRYSSTLYLTSAIDGVGWSNPRPGRFTPGKDTRCPFYRRLGGPQGRSGRVRKISHTPGFDPRTVQPVVSHYTDWATLAPPTAIYRVKKYAGS